MKDKRPFLGISVGDPAGIGPEITAKTLNSPEIYKICRPLSIADAGMMADAVRIAGVQLKINPVTKPSEGKFEFGTIDVLDLKNIEPESVVHKKVSADCGRAAFEYIIKAIDLALEGSIDAVVTGPINKEALNSAGFQYPGHTEIFAERTKTRDYAMMLAHNGFRVIHVSTHVPLKKAIERVKKDRVYKVIKLGSDTLKKMGIEHPRIAVAGLNPHSGESGLFGTEEIKEIEPAIKKAVDEGIFVEGPVPPDSVFPMMQGGRYDLVVTMYHDQGHIPIKTLGFKFDEKAKSLSTVSGVNITCGLPIIRVSVDHGTAFGKAGEGRANPESLIQSIEVASLLAKGSD